MKNAQVAVIMGSSSDWPVMGQAVEVLESFGITVYKDVVSAHRTPDRLQTFAAQAEKDGIQVIVAGAGGAAHLPGMVASFTTLPVVGVPIKSSISYQGLDSLLSIVQMPGGIPVATVAIDGAKNAGILAAQIVALGDRKVAEKLKAFKASLVEKVDAMKSDLV